MKGRYAFVNKFVWTYRILYLCMGIIETVMIVNGHNNTLRIGPINNQTGGRIKPPMNVHMVYIFNIVMNWFQIIILARMIRYITTSKNLWILPEYLLNEETSDDSSKAFAVCIFPRVPTIIGIVVKVWMFVFLCMPSCWKYFSQYYPEIWYTVIIDLSILICILIIMILLVCSIDHTKKITHTDPTSIIVVEVPEVITEDEITFDETDETSSTTSSDE